MKTHSTKLPPESLEQVGSTPTSGAPRATTFAQRLATIRSMSGLTQAQLGTKANIATTSIAHFEGGKREPNLENLIKIVKALGVSADVLLGTARP